VLYKSDNQIKMILGINTWRNLLSDKIIRFAGMMPEMNLNLMMDIVDQLPQFWLFAKSSLKAIDQQEALRQDITQSRKLKEIRKLLDNDLDIEHNSLSDKQYFLETILLAFDLNADPQVLSDRDRQFIATMRECHSHSTRNVVIAALSFVGGRLRQ